MAIGVYRIYLGHAWGDGPASARLIATLDAVSAFLYRIDRIVPEDLAAAASAGHDLAGHDLAGHDLAGTVRVAMTQSHIMLVPVGSADADCHARQIGNLEKELARTGFRRRIPILGVILDDATGSAPDAQGFDGVVTLDPSTLTCTIQALAEAAAAERRQANVIEMARPRKDMASKDMASKDMANCQPEKRQPACSVPAVLRSNDQPRPLPVNEILEAYQRHIGARQTKPPV